MAGKLSEKPPAGHFEFLDLLRGVAILAVLLCHTYAEGYGYGDEFSAWQGWYRSLSAEANAWLYPLSLGRAGVSLFFVISGFCIHLSFRRSSGQWRQFFQRRLFRLYPAYLTALLFVFVLMFRRHLETALTQEYFWWQLGTHLLFIHNFFADTFKGVNAPLWSLAVEVQLYLLYPLLLRLAGKLGWRRTLLSLAGLEILIQAGTYWQPGAVWDFLARSPLGFWFSWTLGVVIAEAHLNGSPKPFLNIPAIFWLGLGVAADFIRPLQPFGFTLFALASASYISRYFWLRPTPPEGPAWPRRWFATLGVCSYSLYLLHYPLLAMYYNVLDWLLAQPTLARPWQFLLLCGTWLVIIPLAMLWHKVIEMPGITWGRHWFERPIGVLSGTEAQTSEDRRQSMAFMPGGGTPWCYVSGLMLVFFISAHVYAAARFAPASTAEWANQAWSLATAADSRHRDGVLAVEYARKACRQSGYGQPAVIGILAAAYAETGHYPEAIYAVQFSSDLALKTGDEHTLAVNRLLLPYYQRHRPFHAEPRGTGGARGNLPSTLWYLPQ